MRTLILLVILLIGGTSIAEAKQWGFPKCENAATLAGHLAEVDPPLVNRTVQNWHHVIEKGNHGPYGKQARHTEIEEAKKIVERLRSHGYDSTAIKGLAFTNCSI